ncbi:MAG: hypothetical protein NXI20_25030 [bacterium]|nr:hypothetical protein [bacterium]
MNSSIISFRTEENEEIFVESTISDSEPVLAGKSANEKENGKFEQIIEKIKPIVEGIFKKIAQLPSKPAETKVEFGIKLSAKAGIVISSVDSQANFKVSLTWKKDA